MRIRQGASWEETLHPCTAHIRIQYAGSEEDIPKLRDQLQQLIEGMPNFLHVADRRRTKKLVVALETVSLGELGSGICPEFRVYAIGELRLRPAQLQEFFGHIEDIAWRFAQLKIPGVRSVEGGVLYKLNSRPFHHNSARPPPVV